MVLDKYQNLDLDLMNDKIVLDFGDEIGCLLYDLPSILEMPFLDH